MTRSDKWKRRPVVERYHAFKDMLRIGLRQRQITEDQIFRDGVLGVRFNVPMPKSWSKKKKAAMLGQPHQQKPDLDNMIKGVKDGLLEEDSHVWRYQPEPEKRWAEKGSVFFYIES
jgi:Holliday junction resolvase RusA-like endonuclease